VFPDGGDRYLSERFWQESEPASPALSELSGLRLLASALAVINADAAAGYPHECCGALIGAEAGVVDEALTLDNVTTGERERRFLVSPSAYRRAEAHADATGRRLLGFYHSHPDHPAVPSQFDLDHAWPNLSYVIVSVRNGRPGDVRSWRLRADRSQFDEESLQ
jgi:proteasome lid subunit RPN8/RPN11